ncbi:MAG: lytic transglycosylase domain-containing protein [Candidatus Binatia bacterium]
MNASRKTISTMATSLSFHWLRYRRFACSLGLSSLLLFLVIPTHPLEGESGRGIDEINEAGARKIHETFSIYSVLNSQGVDLSEASVWNVAETILEESLKQSLDPMLVMAIIKVESGFRHKAVSSQGARGLMQIRPIVASALAEDLGLKRWEGEKSLDDPVMNVKLGVFYLGYLKERFRNLKLALTAYNSGPSRVKKTIDNGEALPLGYASRVLSAYHVYRRHSRKPQKVLPNSRQEGQMNL